MTSQIKDKRSPRTELRRDSESKAILPSKCVAHSLFVARMRAHLFLRSWVQIVLETRIFSLSHARDVLRTVCVYSLFHPYLSLPGMLQDFNPKIVY